MFKSDEGFLILNLMIHIFIGKAQEVKRMESGSSGSSMDSGGKRIYCREKEAYGMPSSISELQSFR